MDFFATCPKGLEYLLRDELLSQGADDVHEALAGVRFCGELEAGYRACLESRLASRVLLPLRTFAAADQDALYRGVRDIDWSEHLGVEGSLAVDAVISRSAIQHSRYAAQVVKDAIVDQFRAEAGERPSVELQRPDIRLHLLLRRDQAHLSLDLSGEPLHRRGCRVAQGGAPLKENLAAAMLLRAGWREHYQQGGVLLDPMCGAATLLIEGAWMAAAVAPGLQRDYFGFLAWRGHDAALWAQLHEHATQRAKIGLQQLRTVFYGRDNDAQALAAARRNVIAAGVAGFVHLQRGDVAHLQPPDGVNSGLLLSNPPYGERLGNVEQARVLYRILGERLRNAFSGWRASVLVADPQAAHDLGLRVDRRHQLYNGAIECSLLHFDIHPRSARPTLKPLSEGAQMVANRLRKNLAKLRKWLQREDIHCFRVYDADLPEYSAAIDVYAGRVLDEQGVASGEVQRWLHIQEYQAPATIDAAKAGQRLRDLVRAAGETLQVPRERVAVKTRVRGRIGDRYRAESHPGGLIEVVEAGLYFRVNLFEFLDTGLFLDHRLVRAQLRELAQGRRMLNLFAYTGTASTYAAAGGAEATVSVDLSATYLQWASWNLARNGFSGSRHRLEQADARRWLSRHAGRFGLIYVDPPTFSNSKRAEDFNIQHDHVDLLKRCGDLLEPGGVVVFSNHFKRFRLDNTALEAFFEIEDGTAASIPCDFARRSRIHGCWLLRPR